MLNKNIFALKSFGPWAHKPHIDDLDDEIKSISEKQKQFVKTVNKKTPDEDGNVDVKIPDTSKLVSDITSSDKTIKVSFESGETGKIYDLSIQGSNDTKWLDIPKNDGTPSASNMKYKVKGGIIYINGRLTCAPKNVAGTQINLGTIPLEYSPGKADSGYNRVTLNTSTGSNSFKSIIDAQIDSNGEIILSFGETETVPTNTTLVITGQYVVN